MDTDLLKLLSENNDEEFRLTMVASLLRYLIDPQADHGLRSWLLMEILGDASQSWPAIDQALLDSLDCFPGIPDLDIEITETEGHRFVAVVRYETARFIIGFQACSSSATTATFPEDMQTWNSLLADSSRWSCPSRTPRITKDHRGLVLLGTPKMAARHDPANALVGTVRGSKIDAVHPIPWRKHGRKACSGQRSVQEVIEATITKVASGYLNGATPQTMELLRRLNRAINTTFHFRS